MPYDVQVRQVDPQTIAAVRRRARLDQLSQVVPAACGEVWQFIRASGLPHPDRNVAVYLDNEINLECGVIVGRPFSSTSAVICSATPGGRVATTIHLGPYHLLGEAHHAISDWCAAQSYKLIGPNWEIYDHWNDDPSKLRTDAFYLVEDDGERRL